MDATDALTQFVESRAIRYQHDRTYRQQLDRERPVEAGKEAEASLHAEVKRNA